MLLISHLLLGEKTVRASAPKILNSLGEFGGNPWDERVRNFLSTSIWLEVDHDTRWARRVHFKYPEYEKKVLKPMHKQFAEPTKQYATHVVDVTNLTKEAVFKKAETIVRKFLK